MRWLPVLLVCCCPILASAQGKKKPPPGIVEGEALLTSKANPKTQIRTFRRLVVYLRPLSGQVIPIPPTRPVIRQRGARFSPPLLVVARGQTVVFPNDDDLYHNVFSYSPSKRFDLGLFKSGTSRSLTFDKAGPVRIHCSIHRTMNGTIFVADTRFHTAPIDGPGRFRFTGVPPGAYQVRTWHPRFPVGATRIQVRSGKTTTATVRLGKTDAEN